MRLCPKCMFGVEDKEWESHIKECGRLPITRNNDIEQIIYAIKKLWLQHSEQRFGQLLENYVFPSVMTKNGGRTANTFYQEDIETYRKIVTNINYKEDKCNKCTKKKSKDLPDLDVSAIDLGF